MINRINRSTKMFGFHVNKTLLPIKANYFLVFGCIGPILGFLPTYVRQLGYSVTTYGVIMTFMTFITMPLCPAVGMIVDKFRVKKLLFLTTLFGMGLMVVLFMLVPKLPVDTAAVAELTCDRKTGKLAVRAGKETTIFAENDTDGVLVTCELQSCRLTEPYDHDVLNNQRTQSANDSNDSWFGSIGLLSSSDRINVAFKLEDVEQVSNLYVFHLSSVLVNGTETSSTSCSPQNSPTYCSCVNCSHETVMRVATNMVYGWHKILGLYQFWILCSVIIMFNVFMLITSALQNPICLETLDDKSEDYGKQRCWASIGWGLFSILVGLLVDVFSTGKKEKNYSPIFCSGVILTIFNLYVVTKIKVTETRKSKVKRKKIYGLFTRFCVIFFYVWALLNSLFHTISTSFTFWYMEELTLSNNDRNQLMWLKTLQGLAQAVQCFCGEIPFFFWSGWIIKRLGHVNCMTLALGAMALRLYLYTVIWNPGWIVLIELLNGVTHSLAFAVKMSYAKKIALPDTLNTVIGYIMLIDMFGDSLATLLGGYIFGWYGGVWSFRFFAFGAALMCFLTILTNNVYPMTEDIEKLNFISVTIDPQKTITNDDGVVIIN
ncbi:Major facilitator superfamily domain,Major facilitator superfamily associated domain [Cinara cedri]|uniref:Major facilitator superfamily domain,Major facilitator superfamily associated domain n=1 Tax=Cinara cedri TaxID=506608 RepID=A0A5E4N084_9HEMI|nr:Major facilitator superfamily domain,Major facilitator superfamily associated domain [Cinara cedri]